MTESGCPESQWPARLCTGLVAEGSTGGLSVRLSDADSVDQIPDSQHHSALTDVAGTSKQIIPEESKKVLVA